MGQPKATIVLDTSALLHGLSLIQALSKRIRVSSTEFLLPRTTLRELDKIKDREKFSPAGSSARAAINWVNESIIRQDPDTPWIRGQRAAEMTDPTLRGDDAILDCAEYNSDHYRRITVMMSHDRNLLNRAAIEGIETLDIESMSVSAIIEALRSITENVMDFEESWPSSYSQTKQAPTRPSQNKPQAVSQMAQLDHDTDQKPQQEEQMLVTDGSNDMEVDGDAVDVDEPPAIALESIHAPGSRSSAPRMVHAGPEPQTVHIARKNNSSDRVQKIAPPEQAESNSRYSLRISRSAILESQQPAEPIPLESMHDAKRLHHKTDHSRNTPVRSISASQDTAADHRSDVSARDSSKAELESSSSAPESHAPIVLESIHSQRTAAASITEGRRGRHNRHASNTKHDSQDPSESFSGIPAPPEHYDTLEKGLTQMMSTLIDWHVRWRNSPSRLAQLAYKHKPRSFAAIASVLENFKNDFEAVVSVDLIDRFVAAAREHNRPYINTAAIPLILNLSGKDPRYVQAVARLK